MIRPRAYVHFAAAVLAVGVLASVDGAQHRQTFAPHELGNSDGPAPIVWPTPELLKRSFDIESAEERRLKVVVVAKGLEQPWSVAFVPDGSMLVTERIGRLRIVRDGKLEESPVAGVPRVQTGGPRGLQGLMDVVLHPQFDRNRWVYLTYHKAIGRRRRCNYAGPRNMERRRAGERAGHLRIRRHRHRSVAPDIRA